MNRFYYCGVNLHWKPTDVCDKKPYKKCLKCGYHVKKKKLIKRVDKPKNNLVKRKSPKNTLVRRKHV